MDQTSYLHTLRLAARVHGLVVAQEDRLGLELVEIFREHLTMLRRPKSNQRTALLGEWPVFLLILTLQEVERAEGLPLEVEVEFFKSCLVHFFASHYAGLYRDHKDPIQETLAKVDWYLDSQDGPPEASFAKFAVGLFAGLVKDPAPAVEAFIRERVRPEILRALELAPKYRLEQI
jgi:hypothetical protein